jgi:hypothetical protein
LFTGNQERSGIPSSARASSDQEVVNAMAAEGNLWSVAKGIHIHPALSEVVLKAFGKLQEAE